MIPLRTRITGCVFIALFTLLGTLNDVTAQIRLGLLGGANFASLNEIQANGNLVSLENATAYHAGAFLDLTLGPLSLRPAAYYLNAGSLFKGASFQEDEFDVAYVTIPVDVIFSMGVGPVKPYLFAGPEFRLLSSADAPAGLDEELNNFTMGASLGLGLELNLPGSGITLYPHLRYSFGLSDLTSKTYQVQGVTVDTGGDSRVNMWLLSLGIGF